MPRSTISRIGANAVVVKPSPPNSVIIGVPGQIVVCSQGQSNKPDLEHGLLPDTIGETLSAFVAHVEKLEKRLDGYASVIPAMYMSDYSIWRGRDFAI
jgi:serine O-acetyltransferase